MENQIGLPLGGQEVPDRNRGVAQDEVATHHETAQSMAHNGSAGGVSVQPSFCDGGDKTLPMPSHDELKRFLAEYYLHSRFVGRDGPQWGNDYSDVVTKNTLEALEEHGISCVSIYECARGRVVWFNRSLTVLNPDAPPEQIQAKAGNLTHIYGASM